MPVARRLEACPYRIVSDAAANRDARCGWVARVIDVPLSALNPVAEAACRKCCQFALPSGLSLNPVLASLVTSESDRLCAGVSPESPRRASLELARSFAMPWLARGDVGGGRCGEEVDGNPLTLGAFNAIEPHISHQSGLDSEPTNRIGLVGKSQGCGVANINLDIATHLGIDRWLLPATPRLPVVAGNCELDLAPPTPTDAELTEWLRRVDTLLFVERPVYEALPRLAKAMGIRVVCIPMWEWLDPRQDWLRHVDQMIGATAHTLQVLKSWQDRFGFGWKLAHVPWPVNTERFPFFARVVCRRFVHVHGGGGYAGKLQDGSQQVLRRKGLEVLLDAARLAPEIPIIIYAPQEAIRRAPANVEVRIPPADNRLLYVDGDVCVQPSHWEGLGLPLLECQAAGMPLVTTDHSPMNEHRPISVVPCQTQTIELAPGLFIEAARIQSQDLAATLRAVHGKCILWHSWRARQFVHQHQSWRSMAARIRSAMATPLLASSARHKAS